MKLVNIHKHIQLLLFILIGVYSAQAQVLSLQQCIDTAQVHNKNLQMGSNNISIGEQKAKEAKANLYPKVTVNADYKYFTNLPYQFLPLSTFNPTAPEGQFNEAQFGVPHNINANVQLSMPLYNPQVYGAIQSTKLASELTKLQYQKTEEQIYFEISNLYYNAQILHHQIGFIDSNLINADRLLKNIQLLKELLLAKETDVSKVKLQVSQLTNQKENLGSKYEQVLNALKFAMGVSIDLNLSIDPNIDYQNTFAYVPTSTLDIRLIKTQNLILSNDLNVLNKSRYLPSVNLIGQFGTTGFGYNGPSNSFLSFYPIGFAGIQITYPLYDGKVTQRKINQKQFEVKNNELQYSLLTEQNSMQVENAKLQIKITNKSIETSSVQIELAKAIYDQTILLQKQGLATLADVLLADNALRETQQTHITSIIDYLKAELELKKLTGNISTSK